MTQPPSYRKVNPADAPVLFIALTSPSMSLSDLNDYAEHLISPTLSTLDGVAQVNVFGQKRFAVRVRVLPDALAARNITPRRADRGAARRQRQHAGRHARGAAPDADLQANRQLRNAAEFAELIVANAQRQRRCACATSPTVEDSFETVKTAATFNGETLDLAGGAAPARRQHRARWSTRCAPTLPSFRAQLPQSVRIIVGQRPLGVDPRRAARRDADACSARSCWWCW